MIPELFNEMSRKFESVAQKVVQKSAREKLPEIIEKQLELAIQTTMPKYIREQSQRELSQQAREYVEPEVSRAKKKMLIMNVAFFVLMLLALGGYVAADIFDLIPPMK